jgi:hypothetical protein
VTFGIVELTVFFTHEVPCGISPFGHVSAIVSTLAALARAPRPHIGTMVKAHAAIATRNWVEFIARFSLG